MGIKDRLLKLLEVKELSQGRFEKLVGLSNGFVNNIGEGISTKSLNKIKKRFQDLNESWLLTGQGKMFVTEEGIEYTLNDLDAANAYAKKDPLNKIKHGEWELVGRYMRDELAFYMAKATGRRLQDCLDEVNDKISRVLES